MASSVRLRMYSSYMKERNISSTFEKRTHCEFFFYGNFLKEPISKKVLTFAPNRLMIGYDEYKEPIRTVRSQRFRKEGNSNEKGIY